MRAIGTVLRERGVVTIPASLRKAAGVDTGSELTLVQLEPDLWLVGPKERHPEEEATLVVTALHAKASPFPTILQRALTVTRATRGRPRHYEAGMITALSEEQMLRRGEPAEERRFSRGR